METFEETWRRFHPVGGPLGWMMRCTDEPWIRFHSLPDSKRYAENDDERRIVLERANALANTSIGHKSPCWLILPKYPEDDLFAAQQDAAIDRYQVPFAFEYHMPDEEEGEESVIWKFHARLLTWRNREFDELIAKIADDEARAIWMSAKRGVIFAPYDGGTDLFLSAPGEVTIFRDTFPAWLPTHPEGL